MKKTVLVLIGLILLAAPATAQTWKTKSDTFACITRADALLYDQIVESDDAEAMADLYNALQRA